MGELGVSARPVVLVVDDDEDHVTMLQLGLEIAGFDVITAYSCAKAKGLLAERWVDALVADLMLGDDTSLELLAPPARRPRVAIVLSGFDAPEDVARTKAAGYDAHVVKPAELRALARMLREGLERTASGVRLVKARPAELEAPKRSTG